MIAAVETIQAELAAIAGGAAVSADPEICRAFAAGGLQPKLVVYPGTAEQVAALLQCASERDLAVIPVRNGTKLAVGNAPRRYDLALSLKSLNRVWHYEPADLTVVVEPGMKLGDFQHFLARDGLWLPLDPRGGERASLGGILASNATGPLRGRFGAPRDMVLGMKIATGDGKIIKTGGRVVKNVAGYDMGKLLIGSWGTLGVIVEACFKLFPRPAARRTYVLGLPDLDAARDLRAKILHLPLSPLRMALIERAAAQLLEGAGRKFEIGNSKIENGNWKMETGNSKIENRNSKIPSEISNLEFWIEAGGSEKVLARYDRDLGKLAQEAGIRFEKRDDASALWDRVADFGARAAETSPEATVLRAALPLDSSEEFLQAAADQAQAFLSQPANGVVTLVLTGERAGANPLAATVTAVATLRDRAEKLGGALIVERCSQELKAQLSVWGSPGDDFEMMRHVKSVWDPKGILSPGRFLGGI